MAKPTPRLRTCPKCGFDKVTGEECPRCGIIINKFLQPGERSEHSARQTAQSAPSPAKTSGKKLAALVLGVVGGVVVIAAAVALLTMEREPGYLKQWLAGAAGYEQALAEQAKTKKPLFVYFDTVRCERCSDFDRGPLAADVVQQYLSQALLVRIDPGQGEQEAALSVKYGVADCPALFAMAAGGASPRPVPIYKDGEGKPLRSPEELLAAAQQAVQLQAAVSIASGVAAFQAGEVDKAIAMFDEAVKKERDNAQAYQWRGQAYFKKGEREKALADFVSWIRIEEENPLAFEWAAAASRELKKYDDAVIYLDQLIKLDPKYKNGQAYFLRSDTEMKMNNFDVAMRDAQQACQLGHEEGCRVVKANQKRR
ncbi:MAG: tetratricopeptide repeat protein [Deltaproteobacteria bacterium]|nr:tetratricopeptide repeat protein [Deltaproteobacteria bacterium]